MATLACSSADTSRPVGERPCGATCSDSGSTSLSDCVGLSSLSPSEDSSNQGCSSPRSSDAADDAPTVKSAQQSAPIRTMRIVPPRVCTDMPEGPLADMFEDSDEDDGPLSPSKSAKRRMRRRRQREAIKAAAADAPVSHTPLAEVRQAPPAPCADVRGRERARTIATLSDLGFDLGPQPQASNRSAQVMPTLGANGWNVPPSPSCAMLGPLGLMSTSPNHDRRASPTAVSEASTRLPSHSCTPLASVSNSTAPSQSLMFSAQQPGYPGSVPHVLACPATGAPAARPSPTSTMPPPTMNCSAMADASARSPLGLCTTPSSAHPAPALLQSVAASHIQLARSPVGDRVPNLACQSPTAQAGTAQSPIADQHPDLARILFGAMGPPSCSELLQRLEAAAPLEPYYD